MTETDTYRCAVCGATATVETDTTPVCEGTIRVGDKELQVHESPAGMTPLSETSLEIIRGDSDD